MRPIWFPADPTQIKLVDLQLTRPMRRALHRLRQGHPADYCLCSRELCGFERVVRALRDRGLMDDQGELTERGRVIAERIRLPVPAMVRMAGRDYFIADISEPPPGVQLRLFERGSE